MLGKIGNDLYLPRGDTGKLKVNIKSQYLATDNDRILFTVKTKANEPVIIRVVTPVANTAVIEFTNQMTKNLPLGKYKYDIRFIRDAVLEEGVPVGGDGVDTPRRIGTLNLLETAGEV